MFTGIVEKLCTVKSANRGTDSMQLVIDLQELAKEAKVGDSIAVNGVCLTVAKLNGSEAAFDISTETLTKSTLGQLQSGTNVNIERALKPNDRFGGHFVLGHTDGTVTIKQIQKHNDFAEITFSADAKLLEQMVTRGSVAVDGISLTIADTSDSTFTIALIPTTLEKTTLGSAKPGDKVNIETDMIVKTVKKQLSL